MSIVKWTDPDSGAVWELNYVVAQRSGERDHMVYRIEGGERWHVAPPCFLPPPEVAEVWFGPAHADG